MEEIANYKRLTLRERKKAAAKALCEIEGDATTRDSLDEILTAYYDCRECPDACADCEFLQLCDIARAKIDYWDLKEEEEEEEPTDIGEELATLKEDDPPVNNRQETGVTTTDGRFPKGRSGNPKGRPKGAVNKTTKDFRDLIKRVMNECFDAKQLREDIESLPPAVRVATFLRLLRYVLPEKKEEDWIPLT